MGEFDSNPVAKSLKAYHDAKATGGSDGSMAGNLSVADRKKEQEQWRKSSSSTTSGSSSNSSKIICTELRRQGLMSREDYERCARHAREHLSGAHLRGYHLWALPVVRKMRRSQRATAFWRYLAQARADYIASLYGDQSRRNRLGAILCAIGHPACRLIGGLAPPRDWQGLYVTDGTNRLS